MIDSKQVIKHHFLIVNITVKNSLILKSPQWFIFIHWPESSKTNESSNELD